MNGLKVNKIYALLFLLSMFSFVPTEKIIAQDQVISLEIEVSSILENSQFIGLTNLGIDKDGRGPVLVSGFIQNITQEKVDNLYLEAKIFAGKIGPIINITSEPGFLFSLNPMQPIYITNNTIAEDRIPGINEVVRFDSKLTPEGDAFIKGLDGSTTLPNDTYIIEVTVLQTTNENGKVVLASAQAEIGGGVPVSESVDFFLRTPGDITDANVEITNPYPQFSWEGEQGIEYRLIVVRSSNNDSPESQLQNAFSSPSTSEGGSLLQYENLDVKVVGESFQYPSSGAQPLELGQTYYWQLSTTIQSGIANEERTSEIWGFKLAEPKTAEAPIVINDETKKAILSLMGNATFENLVASGYTLQSFQIDGISYTGAQASVILTEILRKIENGDIVLSGGN